MDRLSTRIMAMVTVEGMALGTAATLGLLRAAGKIRVRFESMQ